MAGYCEQILRVNLSIGKITTEPLVNPLKTEFLGGKGFGAKILYDEVKEQIDPYSPDNKLIFATGPFTGTAVPTANRYGVFFKSPLTGLFGESYSGGFFAPEIKKAGYDIIIIEGKSEKPVYLQIVDSSIELVDARSLWGLDTYETENALKKEVGKKIQVACIGPAGENLVRFACICNGWRQAGRCGGGAIMGSKLLKAIVIRGSEKIEIADEDTLLTLSREVIKRIPKDLPMSRYGTPIMVDLENAIGTFPTRYWHKGVFEGASKINAEAMAKEIFAEHRACWNCPIRCGKLSIVKDGKYAGTKVEGPDYETIYALGGLCEIDDIRAIARANELCDRLGIDTMTAGNVIAFAMDAYESGHLKLDFPLRFGDPDVMLSLIEKIAYKEGFGELLSEGVKRIAEKLGLKELAIHVKGLEPAGYDPRGLKGAGLSYVTSSRGACHNRSSVYALESRGEVNRLTISGKASLTVEWEDKIAIFDSLIICNFIRRFVNWDDLTAMYEAVIGTSTSKDKLRIIAQRTISLSRKFSLREGLSRKDDSLPKRFAEEPLPEGPSKECTISYDELDKMLKEYYSLRGWNEEGVPQ